ncbi:MAG TPA: AraC family transcriptional regulator [Verrucomicrobiae bacterium]|nr:AraC family transcriptional regulator [Verrucomicrobiae bacterium]
MSKAESDLAVAPGDARKIADARDGHQCPPPGDPSLKSSRLPATIVTATPPMQKQGIDSTQPHFFSAQVAEARRFYLDLTPRPRERLVVACGGLEHCAPDYRIDRRTFPFLSVEFVARGRGSIRLGRKSHTLTPGTAFAYGPGIAQRITADPNDPPVKYFVDFSGREALPLLKRCGLPPGTLIRTSAPSQLLGIFDDLVRTGQSGSAFARPICALLVELLLHRIAETARPTDAVAPAAFATYERCRRHMQAHFLRLGSVEDAARECHVDPAYLSRLFRRFDRQTPHVFMMHAKMQFAAERLRVPGIMVKEVAADVGFADPFQFSRAFKAVYGVSPSEFIARRAR